MSVSEIISKKLENLAVDVKVKKDRIVVSSVDGCAYIFSLNGNEIYKKCFDIPLKSADVMGDVVYAIGKDNILRIARDNEVSKVRLGFSATRAFALGEVVLVCGNKCDAFKGERRLWSVDVGQVIGKVRREDDKLYAPDNVLKRIHIISLEGKVMGHINVNEKAFDLDIDEERIYVGTSRRVLALTKEGNVLWSVEPGWFNFVCSANDSVFVAVRNSKKLIIYTKDGKKEQEFELSGKPGMIDCNGKAVAVISENILTILKLEAEEEVEEVKAVKEETKPETVEIPKAAVEEKGLLMELREISEGDYMGSPLTKEVLKEVESALESLEVKQSNLNDAIDELLKEINELMNIGGADWKSVLERYERAYEKVMVALNLIENAKKLIGDVKDCPPIEEILKGLREKSAAKFINFLVSLSKGEGSPAERAKEGAEKVKLCVLKEVLKVDDEKVKELEQKKEKLEADISALKALLGEA